MLPIISQENVENVTGAILSDIQTFRKEMIYYIKDENPELNTAIIEIAQKADLDAKALATGAYMAYKLLENEVQSDEFFDEDDNN